MHVQTNLSTLPPSLLYFVHYSAYFSISGYAYRIERKCNVQIVISTLVTVHLTL